MRVPLSPEILVEASQIKVLLGIEEDNYHPKGVCENDLLIIATAKIEGYTLVTEESRQNFLPNLKSKMKIPAVCAEGSVSVKCIRSIELIRSSGKVFE